MWPQVPHQAHLPGIKSQGLLTPSHCLCKALLRTYCVPIGWGVWRKVRYGFYSWTLDLGEEQGQSKTFQKDYRDWKKIATSDTCQVLTGEAFGQSSGHLGGRCEFNHSFTAQSLAPQNLQRIWTQAPWFQNAEEIHRAHLALESLLNSMPASASHWLCVGAT